MKETDKILRRFVLQEFPDCDESVIKCVTAVATLEKGDRPEAEDIRSITINKDAAGEISAESIKLYNLLNISTYDLIALLLGGAGIMLDPKNAAIVCLAILKLIHGFYPKLKHKFNEQDAKLLLCIFMLGRKDFLQDDVVKKYEQQFSEKLRDDQQTVSFKNFEKLHVLRNEGLGKYLVREEITCKRV